MLWIPVILWCGVIFFFSSLSTLPAARVVWWDFLIKKTAHISEYGLLLLLVYRALWRSFASTHMVLFGGTQSVIIWCFVFNIFFAFSDEVHQSFTPGRTPTLMDVGFDIAGTLVGLWMVTHLEWLRIKLGVEDWHRYRKN